MRSYPPHVVRFFHPFASLPPPSRSYELFFNEVCISAAPRAASWCAFIVAAVSGRENRSHERGRIREQFGSANERAIDRNHRAS